MGRTCEPIEPRFWKHVLIGDGCWLWMGTRIKAGYGVFSVQGRPDYAHRISLGIHLDRPLTKAEEACHRCDNPPCVRFGHLFLGTHADNMKDAGAKGRMVYGSRRPNAKLTEEQVRQLREIYRGGGISQDALAKNFGVSIGTLNWALRGKTWRRA